MDNMGEKSPAPEVLRLRDTEPGPVADLLAGYGLNLTVGASGASIPGSYWGPPEAGLVKNALHARPDTPLHSILHEACHYICMPPDRRTGLDTDAGGDYDEENAVCYLQILLAARIPGFGKARCMADMDAWGYTFRLGSAGAWFHGDAGDARGWLAVRDLIDGNGHPTGCLRGADARFGVA